MHLIVGKGKMGDLHGSVLKELGEQIEYEDKWKNLVKDKQYKEYASVLVCTPPDERDEFFDLGVPTFFEKPVITHPKPTWVGMNPKTLVACNYRFHKDFMLKILSFIEYGYPHGKYPELDLIHFVDVAWERYGKPEYGHIYSDERYNHLTMKFPGEQFTHVIGDKIHGYPYTFINGEPRDDEETNEMFVRQMRHWLDVVSGRAESVNPISKAIERTNWLIEVYNDRKTKAGIVLPFGGSTVSLSTPIIPDNPSN